MKIEELTESHKDLDRYTAYAKTHYSETDPTTAILQLLVRSIEHGKSVDAEQTAAIRELQKEVEALKGSNASTIAPTV